MSLVANYITSFLTTKFWRDFYKLHRTGLWRSFLNLSLCLTLAKGLVELSDFR